MRLRHLPAPPRIQLRSLQARWVSGAPPSAGGANDYQFGPSNDVQPQPSTQVVGGHEGKAKKKSEKDSKGDGDGYSGAAGMRRPAGCGNSGGNGTHSNRAGTAWKMFESAATTTASLSILGYVTIRRGIVI